MPLNPAVKEAMEKLTGKSFDSLLQDWEMCGGVLPTMDARDDRIDIQERPQPVSAVGRGYVRFGESVSAVRADQRNEKILRGW